MTRWARSGSTQKHRKMPEDATPWKEFVKDVKMKNNSYESKKIKKGFVEQKRHQTSFDKGFSNHKLERTLVNTNTSKSKDITTKDIKKREQNTLNYSKEFNVYNQKVENDHLEHSQNTSNSNCTQVSAGFSASKVKKERKDVPQYLTKTQLERTNRKNKKFQHLKTNKQSNNYQERVICKTHNEREETLIDDKPFNDTNFSRMKKPFERQFHEKSLKKGFVPLPMKLEQKLQDTYRQLQRKGLAAEEIKNIMRKRRRTEKNKQRKILCSKPCFNCRQRGHLLANCPLTLDPSKQGTNICFKCGSAEHKSSSCTKKIEGYPLAKCFICEKQGHISKDCPQNKHGVYPDGGKCSLCGNINHLRKDCPSLAKKKEEIVSAHVIKEGRSIDDEIVEPVVAEVKSKVVKKPKIVQFF